MKDEVFYLMIDGVIDNSNVYSTPEEVMEVIVTLKEKEPERVYEVFEFDLG